MIIEIAGEQHAARVTPPRAVSAFPTWRRPCWHWRWPGSLPTRRAGAILTPAVG